MLTETCGVIERGTDLYEIEIELNEEQIKELLNG